MSQGGKKREPRKSFFAGFELLCNHWNASRGGICLSIKRENGLGLLLLLLFLSFPCLEIEGRRRKRISFSFLSEWRREEEEGEVTSPFDIHKKVPSSFLFSPRCMKRAAGTGFSKQKWQNKSRSYSSQKKTQKYHTFLFKCRYCICKFIRGKPGPFPKRDLSSSCICILTHCIPYRPPMHSHSHSNSLSSLRETGKGTGGHRIWIVKCSRSFLRKSFLSHFFGKPCPIILEKPSRLLSLSSFVLCCGGGVFKAIVLPTVLFPERKREKKSFMWICLQGRVGGSGLASLTLARQ